MMCPSYLTEAYGWLWYTSGLFKNINPKVYHHTGVVHPRPQTKHHEEDKLLSIEQSRWLSSFEYVRYKGGAL